MNKPTTIATVRAKINVAVKHATARYNLMKRVITIAIVFAAISGCLVRVEPSPGPYDCYDDQTWCHWDNDTLTACCPNSHPFCGVAGTSCGVGECCAVQPE